MNIQDCVDFLNFWIRKERGAFYTIPETMQLIDRAQMAYYNDILPRYATSQIIKDCLSPFREKLSFTDANTDDGELVISASDYLDLLDVTIYFTENGRTVYYPVKMTNEDELGDRLNSQIDPPLATAPVAEMVGLRTIQFYPQEDVYSGTVRYLRRPVAPEYEYDVIDGRIIEFTSGVDLEWRDSDIDAILLKALSSIGINLSDQEVQQYAEMKTQQNYQGVNHQ
jgi:hypothetical protein